MKKTEGKMSLLVMFAVAFTALVASVYIFEKRNDNDFTKFKAAAEAMKKEAELLSKKIDAMSEENKKLLSSVEAAHGQADAAKSKAEVAENLAHKVAIDIAKRPIQAAQAHAPIKVEPIRVIIYDKRDLQKTTKTVKQQTAEQKVIKKVKEKMKVLNQ